MGWPSGGPLAAGLGLAAGSGYNTQGPQLPRTSLRPPRKEPVLWTGVVTAPPPPRHRAAVTGQSMHASSPRSAWFSGLSNSVVAIIIFPLEVFKRKPFILYPASSPCFWALFLKHTCRHVIDSIPSAPKSYGESPVKIIQILTRMHVVCQTLIFTYPISVSPHSNPERQVIVAILREGGAEGVKPDPQGQRGGPSGLGSRPPLLPRSAGVRRPSQHL